MGQKISLLWTTAVNWSVALLTGLGNVNYVICASEFWSHGICTYLPLPLRKILPFIFGILKLQLPNKV